MGATQISLPKGTKYPCKPQTVNVTQALRSETWVRIPGPGCKWPVKPCFEGTHEDILQGDKVDPTCFFNHSIAAGTCADFGYTSKYKVLFFPALENDPILRKLKLRCKPSDGGPCEQSNELTGEQANSITV